MSECTQNCDSCKESCSSGKGGKPQDMTAPLHQHSKVKKVIGVVSGKGGVGKSLITSTLAVMFNRKGYHTAVLDADITGPSIPKAFGITEKATGSDEGIYPVKTASGIDIMSVNLLLENETDPVIWRGPILAGTVKQFWTDVIWEDVDYLFVDMPPGTGDVVLTVFQSLPLDGIVIVTSPQELVSMIVAKAVKMAKMMSVPILGILYGQSYTEYGFVLVCLCFYYLQQSMGNPEGSLIIAKGRTDLAFYWSIFRVVFVGSYLYVFSHFFDVDVFIVMLTVLPLFSQYPAYLISFKHLLDIPFFELLWVKIKPLVCILPILSLYLISYYVPNLL